MSNYFAETNGQLFDGKSTKEIKAIARNERDKRNCRARRQTEDLKNARAMVAEWGGELGDYL